MVLSCRCSASSSAIFLTIRVVLSISVSGLECCTLVTDVFFELANGKIPLRLQANMSERDLSSQNSASALS